MFVYTHGPCNDGRAAARAFRTKHPDVIVVDTPPDCSACHKKSTVSLVRHTDLGMTITTGSATTGPLVSRVARGSVADKTGLIRAGDTILSVNGVSLVGRPHANAVSALSTPTELELEIATIHRDERVFFLDVCPSPELAAELVSTGCEVNIIDHHVGNVANFERINQKLGHHVGDMVLEPTGAGSATMLVCLQYGVPVKPLWRLVSEADTYAFDVFTMEETRIVYYVLDQEGDAGWDRLEALTTHQAIKTVAANYRDAWRADVEAQLAGVEIIKAFWTVNGTTYNVRVAEVLDYRLTGLVVDLVQVEHCDFVLMHRPTDDGRIKWSVRRGRAGGPDCHLVAQTMGGNGHAGAAGFCTSDDSFLTLLP